MTAALSVADAIIDAVTGPSDDDCGGFLPPASQCDALKPILVSVRFQRAKGRASMIVDARPLHAYLERIGVGKTQDPYTGCYHFVDRPSTRYKVVDTNYMRISTEVLLRADGPHEFNLLEVFSTAPSGQALRDIGASVREVVDAIVDHYRPIEISVVVHEKVAK